MNTTHQFLNNSIIVLFDHDWDSAWVTQANGLVVPERFMIESGDEDAGAAFGVTTDRRLINPQTLTVVQGNEAWLNTVKETYPEHEKDAILKAHPPILPGRYFVHYGAFEVAKWLDKEHHGAIPGKMLLFGIEPIRCMPGTYLGEEVFGELPMTESGIYLTPQLESKEGVLVRITHVPADGPKVAVGDIVVTIDQNQYELNYEGEKYIKVDEAEIVGVAEGGGFRPMGNRVLVDPLPDADLAERIAENDKRKKMRDYVDHHRLHVSEAYTRGQDPNYNDVPEPKLTHARVSAVGEHTGVEVGDKLLIHRNYGCRLPNNQWILSMDLILGIVSE